MARGKRGGPSLEQDEIPGTESPGRIQELHVLGLQLKDIQDRSMDWRKKDSEKRSEIAATMERLNVTEYDMDGVSLWIEKGKTKVKVAVTAPEDQ